jgi:putative ABC transport system permease protein
MVLGMLAQNMAQQQLNQSTYGGMSAAEMFALLIPAQGDSQADVADKQGKIDRLYAEESVPKGYSESDYLKNLSLLGNVDENKPKTIYLYSASFEDKDKIGELIQAYNSSVPEEKQISYTDYVKLLMSSITTVLNAITYVLIAFVAISLVVSSIMIGIITYISVLERTKEIGILRAIGASKRDVGRVFNAETLIVGFVAGIIGIGSTLLLNQVVNRILFHFTEIPNLKAILPVGGAIILVTISMLLTLIAGLLPSRFAAKKNPVEALRSE